MRVAWVAGLFLMAAISFADDEVKLKNGDRVTGKVTSLAGGKLVIETGYAGKVSIDWAQVVSVKTDAPIKVKIATGELLEGKVSAGAEGRLKIETAGPAAPVEVELAKITHFNEPPTQWHGNINIAAKGTDGNTLTKSFLISAEGTRETESDLLLLRAIFRYGAQSGVLSERSTYGIFKYQYKFSPRFYGYASEELISDTFKDISMESITSVGAGFDILKEPGCDLSAELGVAYFDNNFRIAADEAHVGARMALKGRVSLPLGFEFKDLFILYPNFKYGPNFQMRNEATLGTALGGGWNLLGGVITEFNNRPSPGLHKTDDTYFLGLGYTF
jgi:putative salt-induced outer membrane protein YdiY